VERTFSDNDIPIPEEIIQLKEGHALVIAEKWQTIIDNLPWSDLLGCG
jgi:hypothetical protein